MKHIEYMNGYFPFCLDPKDLNPCNDTSPEYQNAHFLTPHFFTSWCLSPKKNLEPYSKVLYWAQAELNIQKWYTKSSAKLANPE